MHCVVIVNDQTMIFFPHHQPSKHEAGQINGPFFFKNVYGSFKNDGFLTLPHYGHHVMAIPSHSVTSRSSCRKFVVRNADVDFSSPFQYFGR